MNISIGDGVYAWLNGESESRPNLVALGGPLGEIDEYMTAAGWKDVFIPP